MHDGNASVYEYAMWAPIIAFVRLYNQTSMHHFQAMSFKSITVSLPLLWRCATALPAGPGFFPNGSTPSATSEIHSSSIYGLIDNYDAGNWLSKFDVQDISDPTRM